MPSEWEAGNLNTAVDMLCVVNSRASKATMPRDLAVAKKTLVLSPLLPGFATWSDRMYTRKNPGHARQLQDPKSREERARHQGDQPRRSHENSYLPMAPCESDYEILNGCCVACRGENSNGRSRVGCDSAARDLASAALLSWSPTWRHQSHARHTAFRIQDLSRDYATPIQIRRVTRTGLFQADHRIVALLRCPRSLHLLLGTVRLGSPPPLAGVPKT